MKKTICLAVCAMFMVVMMPGAVLAAEKKATEQEQEVMIAGTINDANQIVDKEGQIFGVADTKEGKELVAHVGMKVHVKGTILESEGQNLIKVSVYEIIK